MNTIYDVLSVNAYDFDMIFVSYYKDFCSPSIVAMVVSMDMVAAMAKTM